MSQMGSVLNILLQFRGNHKRRSNADVGGHEGLEAKTFIILGESSELNHISYVFSATSPRQVDSISKHICKLAYLDYIYLQVIFMHFIFFVFVTFRE